MASIFCLISDMVISDNGPLGDFVDNNSAAIASEAITAMPVISFYFPGTPNGTHFAVKIGYRFPQFLFLVLMAGQTIGLSHDRHIDLYHLSISPP